MRGELLGNAYQIALSSGKKSAFGRREPVLVEAASRVGSSQTN